MNIFLSKYYELALALVGLDSDAEGFENEDRVKELLLEKFSIVDFAGFEALVDAIKCAESASIYPFGNYNKPSVAQLQVKEYDDRDDEQEAWLCYLGDN